MSTPPKPVPGPPAGSRKVPVTEVIEATSGPAIRRIRKLRVEVVDARDGKDKGAVFTFAQDEVRIGGSEEADVPLADPSTSREHLAVRLSSNGYQLADLGSTNGTFIGDLRIERVTIAEPTLVRVGQTLLRLVPLAESVEQEISPRARFGRMLGQSAAMRETFALLERVAGTDLTVLLEGETGTGKELAAEGLHDASGRAGQFVAVNCGAIPRELLESELLGHEKGAFTGADRPRPGAFLTADRGTLFLDEVGELPLDMQAKLLRVLERREVKPVGADRAKTVDVRVVAATNRSLAREVSAGRFRQDLYFRLAVVVVRIPPLRTRAGDVRMLAEHIQDELARKRVAAGLQPLARLDERAMAMLLRYDFPGNVRELRNVVERWAVLGAVGSPGDPAGWSGTAPAATGERTSAAPGDVDSALLTLPFHEAKDAWVDRFERAYLAALLERCENNVSRAAREAGVDRRHVQRMMGRFGMKGGDNTP
ncbi:MAG: sigma 54-interacting transcriptional regulator [Polyangiaceae bacterium]